ncbi:amino acid transporter heavy chain SLC3A1-like [Euwallacea fornicatus]|uniref:amino acid transporter heavy chain SLC3A1-like n=1 Tax=Euwallacea fornicatus TaxID=995702 RepID=UPI00338D626C
MAGNYYYFRFPCISSYPNHVGTEVIQMTCLMYYLSAASVLYLIYAKGKGFYTKTFNLNRAEINHDWWQIAVFYHIYPRSFKDSNDDGNGDLQV